MPVMIFELVISAACCLPLVTTGAFGAEKSPETVKDAILQAVGLARDQHVFDKVFGEPDTGDGLSSYEPVKIRAQRLEDGSFAVTFSRLKRGGATDTFDEVFAVEFSTNRTTTKPAEPAKSPETALANERRLCVAIKKVLAAYLTEEKTEILVTLTREKRGTTESSEKPKLHIIVADVPLGPGRHKLFIVNEKDEIEHVSGGR
jgi:hypothetical protein